MVDDLTIGIKIVSVGVGKYKLAGSAGFNRRLSKDEAGAVITGLMQLIDGLMNLHDSKKLHDYPFIEAGSLMNLEGTASKKK